MKIKTHGIIYIYNKDSSRNVATVYSHGNPAYVQLLNTALVLRYIVIVFKQKNDSFMETTTLDVMINNSIEPVSLQDRLRVLCGEGECARVSFLSVPLNTKGEITVNKATDRLAGRRRLRLLHLLRQDTLYIYIYDLKTHRFEIRN